MKALKIFFLLAFVNLIQSCSMQDLNLTQTSGTYVCEKCNPPKSLHFLDNSTLEIIDMESNESLKYKYIQEGQGLMIKDYETNRTVNKMYFIGRGGKNGAITGWDLTGSGMTFSKKN